MAKLREKINLLFNKKERNAFLARRRRLQEIRRIKKLPRYTPSETDLLGTPIQFLDKSVSAIYEEIFVKEVYRFDTPNQTPYIIDCGANVGLSVIYFKQRFPQARILAFEADPNIFSILQQNIARFNFKDVKLSPEVVWNEETTIQFYLEGGSSGHVTPDQATANTVTVQTISLRDYLQEKVDFLKIDIEGAEFDVLESCSDCLDQVEKIFVEYHSTDGTPQQLGKLLQILTNAGFRYYIEHTGLSSAHPYQTIRKMLDMDLQLNIYGYRIATLGKS